MKLPTLALLFSFLQLPVLANASIYTLEYSGHLTDRRTEGITFSDAIHGFLSIDFAASTDISPRDFDARYHIAPGYSDFVTGFLPQHPGTNRDEVLINDGNHPDNPEPFDDGFMVFDGNIVNGLYDQLAISVEVSGLDWIFGDHITEFSFDHSQLNDRSQAVLLSSEYFEGSDGGTVRPIYEAYYDLDFVSLKAVSVSEPTSLSLMFSGVFALMFARVLGRRGRCADPKR